MVPDAEPVHLIANTKISFDLDDVVRDFKRHTSRHSILLIENETESRRECLLDKFTHAGRIHPKNNNHKVWQDKNHASSGSSTASFVRNIF